MRGERGDRPASPSRGGRALTDSQRDWLHVREYLRQHRYDLARMAAAESSAPKVAGTVLLTRPEWIPPEPIPLDAIDLDFIPDVPFRGLSGTDPRTAALCPERTDGERYPSYSAAMADLAAPAVFENRWTYRLLDADLSGSRGRVVCGRGRYFDGVDLGEAAAHEYALAQLTGGPAPLRAALADLCDPTRRPTNLGIDALTVRHDRATGAATFLLHWRDPAKVGHAGGLYMVVPVGVFQPAGDNLASERQDFSLWRCLVREYAEELLGAPEDYHDGQVDYDRWPFAARMTEALGRGLISAHVLGLGVDPLTLATDLLIIVAFDASLFDELFAGLVDTNAEGHLVSAAGAGHRGFPYTTAQIQRMVRHPSMQAAGAAVLALTQHSGFPPRPDEH